MELLLIGLVIGGVSGIIVSVAFFHKATGGEIWSVFGGDNHHEVEGSSGYQPQVPPPTAYKSDDPYDKWK